MLQSVRDLQALANQLESEVKKTRTKQIYQEPVRESARCVVDMYFRKTRPDLKQLSVSEELLLPADGVVHSLLETTHHRSAAKTYKDVVKAVHSSLRELEKLALVRDDGSPAINTPRVDTTDRAIIETLQKLLPSAACSYEQAIRDLSSGARLSWRGPATDLREALRETLDHLAPDANVTAQPGFKLEANTSGPTMKQKVRYILRQRGMSKGAIDTPESAVEAVEQAVGTFVRSVYSRSSISTHTPTDKNEVLRIRDWVRVVLVELLELR
jgi:hypothetical protein